MRARRQHYDVKPAEVAELLGLSCLGFIAYNCGLPYGQHMSEGEIVPSDRICSRALDAHCLFCDPELHGQGQQVLLYSNNFYLFAGLGPIVDGYIIITVQKCISNNEKISSISELPIDWLDELAFLRGMVSHFYRDCFKKEGLPGHPGISFEHGRAGSCIVNDQDSRHCLHPHLCCYPGVSTKWDGITGTTNGTFLWEDITEYDPRPIRGIHDLPELAAGKAYLYIDQCQVDPNEDRLSLAREKWRAAVVLLDCDWKLRSQYLRRLLAARVGQPRLWNWSKYPLTEAVLSTCERFRRWLRQSSDYVIHWGDAVPNLDFNASVRKTNRNGTDRIASLFTKRWEGDLQYCTFERFIQKLSRPVDQNPESQCHRPKVLDAGCGPGSYTKLFLNEGIECVAADFSPQMLRMAYEQLSCPVKTARESLAISHVVLAELTTLPFASQTFDGIWCSAVLLHFSRDDVKQLLSEFYRVLRNSGILYISTRLGVGAEFRIEGRVMHLWTQYQLERVFHQQHYRVVDSWMDHTVGGTTQGWIGEKKEWIHFLLSKNK